VQRKLYPNVDFYSGIVQRAIGIPVKLFTGIFALARTVGWIAQLNEMIGDPEYKIGRPRQLFTGSVRATFPDGGRRPVRRRPKLRWLFSWWLTHVKHAACKLKNGCRRDWSLWGAASPRVRRRGGVRRCRRPPPLAWPPGAPGRWERAPASGRQLGLRGVTGGTRVLRPLGGGKTLELLLADAEDRQAVGAGQLLQGGDVGVGADGFSVKGCRARAACALAQGSQSLLV
jgi:hypothetical protein